MSERTVDLLADCTVSRVPCKKMCYELELRGSVLQ